VCFSYTVPETGSTYYLSGTYTDVTTNTYGCNHTITTIVTITPIIAGTVSVTGSTITCSNTGVSYQWVDCNNAFSFMTGATSQSFSPPRDGSYACIVINSAGCRDTTSCVLVINTGIDENKITRGDIKVYPNPATNYVVVDILKTNFDGRIFLTMYDITGKIVFTQEIASGKDKTRINVAEFAEGFYSISIYNESFSITKKITIVK
jgi:hypothetical protein